MAKRTVDPDRQIVQLGNGHSLFYRIKNQWVEEDESSRGNATPSNHCGGARLTGTTLLTPKNPRPVPTDLGR
jgi:hypothetical protein